MKGISTYTIAGLDALANEDAVWGNGDSTVGVALVLDGVTSPEPDTSGCCHGVPWFVKNMGDSIIAWLGSSRARQLSTEVLLAAIRSAITETASKHRGECDLSYLNTPQATIALAAWDETVVCIAVLCDSYAVVKTSNNSYVARTDPALLLIQKHAPDYGVRRYRNVPGGFHTLAADPSVTAFIRTWMKPRTQVQGLLLTTDGAARYVNEYHLGSWADLYKRVESSVESFVRTLREVEGARHRLSGNKRSDDIAIAWVDFGTPGR